MLEVSIFLKLQDLGADDLGEVAALLDGDGQGLLREGFAHLREVAVLAQKDIIMEKCTIKGNAAASYLIWQSSFKGPSLVQIY